MERVMSTFKLMFNVTIVVALAAPAAGALAADPPVEATPAEALPLADDVEPTEARYPPGRCYGQFYGGGETIKGQCIATCSGWQTGVVVNKRYLPVDGDHDEWCEYTARYFCDAFALTLDSWCWGEERE